MVGESSRKELGLQTVGHSCSVAPEAAPASEQPQDEGSPLGMEEQEDSLGLEELCKPLYCKLCNVTLNSAQQAQAHYQVSCIKHTHMHVKH